MLYKIPVTQDVLDFLEHKNIVLLNSNSMKDRSLKLGDELKFDSSLQVHPYAAFQYGGSILFNMGAFSYSRSCLGGDDGRSNVQNVEIGRYCSIADEVRIFQADHDIANFTTSTYIYNMPSFRREGRMVKDRAKVTKRELKPAPIKDTESAVVHIGHDVWIGSHVALRPGITIGHGACIATGAIVVKDVPPYAIVGGVPAKVIKYRFDEATVEKLLALAWWQYDFLGFRVQADAPMDVFIATVSEQVANGELTPWETTPVTAKDLLAFREIPSKISYLRIPPTDGANDAEG